MKELLNNKRFTLALVIIGVCCCGLLYRFVGLRTALTFCLVTVTTYWMMKKDADKDNRKQYAETINKYPKT